MYFVKVSREEASDCECSWCVLCYVSVKVYVTLDTNMCMVCCHSAQSSAWPCGWCSLQSLTSSKPW